MAAPSFIQEAETSWATTASPKTTSAFAVLTNDVLVAFSITPDDDATVAVSGGGLTWTQQQAVVVADYCDVRIWTAIPGADNGSLQVTFTRSGNSGQIFGGNVLTFRGSDGVGASSKTNVASGAPSLGLTTTQADSAIVVVNGDWATVDGASRTWRTVNSITPTSGNGLEVTYFRDATFYTVYGAYYSDAGSVAAKTVGLSAPSGQKYAIVAVEVKGTSAAAATAKQLAALGVG